MTGRQGRRCRKLLDDLKERRGYSHLKKEALDCTMWRAGFGRGFGPLVRQTTKWWIRKFTLQTAALCTKYIILKVAWLTLFPSVQTTSVSPVGVIPTILHTRTLIYGWCYVLPSTDTIIIPYAHVIYNMIIEITWFLLYMHQSVLALLLTSCGAVGISVGCWSWSSAILWQFPFLGAPLESWVNCDVVRDMFACEARVCQRGRIWC